MNKEEMRVEIAKACGFKPNPANGWYQKRDNEILWFQCCPPDGKPWQHIPDYCNSLDAMHEAEKVLKGRKKSWYYDVMLPNICKADRKEFLNIEKIASATASQRAEAFLKCLNLWKPSTVPKCDSQLDSKDDVLPSKVRVAPSDKSDEERKD